MPSHRKKRDPFFFAVLFAVIFLWFLFEFLHCHLCALSFLLCHLCVPHINTTRKLYDGRTSSASEAECIDKEGRKAEWNFISFSTSICINLFKWKRFHTNILFYSYFLPYFFAFKTSRPQNKSHVKIKNEENSVFGGLHFVIF